MLKRVLFFGILMVSVILIIYIGTIFLQSSFSAKNKSSENLNSELSSAKNSLDSENPTPSENNINEKGNEENEEQDDSNDNEKTNNETYSTNQTTNETNQVSEICEDCNIWFNVSLDKISYNKGDAFEINIDVSADKAVYGFQSDLIFDDNTLHFLYTKKGDFFTQGGIETYDFSFGVVTGKLRFGSTQLQGGGLTGEGTSIILVFSGENVGSSSLVLENIMLFDSNFKSQGFIVGTNNNSVEII